MTTAAKGMQQHASPEGEPLAWPRFASVKKRIVVTNLQMLLDGLGAAPACLVTVESTQGSVPREHGAWMAVFADQLVGTIGGGHLELQAIAEARRRLAGGPVTAPGPASASSGSVGWNATALAGAKPGSVRRSRRVPHEGRCERSRRVVAARRSPRAPGSPRC